jgi:hypothetical protein
MTLFFSSQLAENGEKYIYRRAKDGQPWIHTLL